MEYFQAASVSQKGNFTWASQVSDIDILSFNSLLFDAFFFFFQTLGNNFASDKEQRAFKL